VSSSPKSLPLPERHGRADLQLSPAVMVLLRSGKLVAAVMIAATALSAAFAKVGMTRFYRAEAVLRPISQLMPNGIGASPASALGSSLLGSTLGQSRAQEIVAILESFDFSTAMVERHRLQHDLLAGANGWRRGSDPQWDVFRIIQSRFTCQFLQSTGNITLDYLDPSRAAAQRDLGYFIEDLRAKLREEQIHNTGTAILSLREEARSTPDSLLAAQLYQLVAQELQEQKLAMVDADFAFKVIENPAASDRPYSPNIPMVAGAVGIVALFLCCFALMTIDWWQRIGMAHNRDVNSAAGKRRSVAPKQ